MIRAGIGGALLVLLLVSSCWAYTFLDIGCGAPVFQGSARCRGMGEVALLCEDTPLAVGLNPALLNRLKRPQGAFSYYFFSLKENRSIPVFDSFDSQLGYNTYSANSNLYHDFAIAFCSGPMAQVLNTSFGVALLPAYDFGYGFEEEVRDRNTTSVPADRLLAHNLIQGDGEIRTLSIGGGRSITSALDLGATVEYLFGDYEIEAKITWQDDRPETSDVLSASNLSGVRYRIGLIYMVTKRVDIAASLTSKCELEGDSGMDKNEGLLWFLPRQEPAGGSFTLEYPASYSAGMSFRPRNELLTVVEANVIYTKWSDFKNEALGPLPLDDTFEWHIGIEHMFYNGRPVRFGFLYKPSPKDDETGEAAVTVGSAIGVKGFEVDFAAKVGWREYRYPDVFEDSIFGGLPREHMDLVEETSVSGLITISRTF